MKAVLESSPKIAGFGPVRQMGHVVDDIEAWMAALSEQQSLGPWMLMRNVSLPCVYRGVKSQPVIHVALAYRGDMQIELIQQVNEAPSPYRDAIQSAQYGLHHTAHLSADMNADVKRAMSADCEMVCDIRMMGARYVYMYDAASESYVEFLPASFMMRSMFKQGIAASKKWDGSQKTIVMDLKNVGSIMTSLPQATVAWLSQR